MEDTGEDLLRSVFSILYAWIPRERTGNQDGFPVAARHFWPRVTNANSREIVLQHLGFGRGPYRICANAIAFGTEVPKRCRIRLPHCINLKCALQLPLAATAHRPLCASFLQ